jgi:molecular chaperone DnaK
MIGAYALGVDIGTTFTAAAIYRDGRAETVPLSEHGHGGHTIPSALFLREDGALLIGDQALRRGITEPSRVAREFKRRFGDREPLLLGDVPISTAQLTGHLIGNTVRRATELHGAPPAHVTLTHPAAWGPFVRERMAEAAAVAELSDVGLLVEPVAAAVHYAAKTTLTPGTLIAVYDFGGGTFDATVVRKIPGGFEVVHTEGIDVGGTDFDDAVMRHVATALDIRWSDYPVDDGPVRAALAQVRANAVAAKETLSSDVEATIPVLLPDLRRDVRLTRAEFETAVRIPVLRTIGTMEQCVAVAGVELSELHSVLLVGGSSRVPLVSRLIASELGVPVAVDAHPKYAVCQGAAISAGARLATAQPLWPVDWSSPAAPGPSGPASGPSLPASGPSLPASGPSGPASAASGPALAASGPASGVPVGVPAAEFRAAGTAPPLVDVPATPAEDGAELIAPVVTRVDPVGAGVDRVLDDVVAAAPAADRPDFPVLTDDVPLTVTHTGTPGQTGRALLVAAAVVAVVGLAAGAVVAFGDRSVPPPAARSTGQPSQGMTSAAAVPVAALAEQAVPGQPGEVMTAVTGSGPALVAVGNAANGQPRAWRFSGGAWAASPVPALGAGTDGGWSGVAAGTGGRLVVVGWTAPHTEAPGGPPATTRRAAAWTSTDGRDWRPATVPSDLGELADVVARPGGFLAVGTDWRVDPGSGDGAVLTSPDGVTWQRATARGLDGPGPTTLRRVIVSDSGELVAIGTRFEGGVSRPMVWTSSDGASWTVASTLASAGPAVPSVWGLTRAAGRLTAAGFVSTVDGSRAPVIWAGASPTTMTPYRVEARAAIYAVAGLVAVGAKATAGGWVPAAWTITVPPS